MALVTKIKEYREKAGMKQTELAELVNVRRETIVHLENGKYNPSLKLAMDIASFNDGLYLPWILPGFLMLLLKNYLSLSIVVDSVDRDGSR